ncbi:adenosylcobinamide kinase / adenosylcobinamide-phosphate guanylyltransferase [Amycolatopsis arida]|uniref:Adenosylcobinamide kinase n=1 Tax=Amycolatopsis arida TaxID=587909 RepID=A0A1I5LKE1_9PSEU|nr:bifunctional adenosylcobinamide kinase/adenosylcobinamide-phosphate guanylyltransferase [Amycolatopsis arida]TDX93754.1 adenosylcobinamide kinase/adenosylcobinamide-phosphate guanylyltransferase [Amycolatopsis arida]SFO97839.1 adenosylcobinamide kinase / adenosylcobinamide-phosphate guanylyltransferase [Amycolatopsis arida]
MDVVAARLEAWAGTLRRRGDRSRRDGRVLILGGVRSGKSRHAEHLISRYPQVTYVAAGPPPSDDDPEWAARIAAHRARRPAHWHTLETTDLAEALRTATGPLLIDCLGTWLSRVLGELGAWDQRPGWQQRVDERLADLVDAWANAGVPVVVVSNEVGMGVVPPTFAGRVFRDVLGALNSQVSAHADQVLLVVAGRVLELREKGAL